MALSIDHKNLESYFKSAKKSAALLEFHLESAANIVALIDHVGEDFIAVHSEAGAVQVIPFTAIVSVEAGP